MKLYDIVRNEIKYIFFTKKIWLLLFGVPLVFTILFGFTYSNNVMQSIPTVIYDQDQSSASRSLIQAFADSQRFKIIGVVNSQEEMDQYMDEQEALIAVGIPSDFSKQIKTGHGSEVMLEINGTNIMYPNTALTFGREIITTYNAGLGQKMIEGTNQIPQQALRTAAPIILRERIFNNPTSSYTAFLLPGLTTNGLQIGIILCICTALLREYRNVSLWRTTSPSIIVIGKLLSYWLCAMVAAIMSITLCIVGFDVVCRGNIENLLLIYGAFTFMIVNLGLLLSAITRDERQPINPLTLLYIIPGFLYSGYNWPHIAKNSFAYAYSFLLPMTYTADTVRDILLAGYSPDLTTNATILFLVGIMICLLTIIFCTRRSKSLFATNSQEAQL